MECKKCKNFYIKNDKYRCLKLGALDKQYVKKHYFITCALFEEKESRKRIKEYFSNTLLLFVFFVFAVPVMYAVYCLEVLFEDYAQRFFFKYVDKIRLAK